MKQYYGILLIGMICGSNSGAVASGVTIPNNFTAGTPASAAEVNSNFTAVKSAVDDNYTHILSMQTQLQNFGQFSNAMTIDNHLNVGIGTKIPGAGLVVSGTGIWKSAIGIENTTAGMEWRMSVDDTSMFQITKVTGATFTPLRIFPDGKMVLSNLGLANIPCSTLTINDVVTNFFGCIPGLMIGSQTSSTGILLGESPTSSVDFSWQRTGPGDGYARVYSAKVLALNPSVSNGNVGVRTTTPSLNFFVDGTAGGVSAWQTVSDERFKTNVTTIANSTDKIIRLRGVTFNWRKDIRTDHHFSDKKQIGFVAQEVQDILPEIVHQDQDGVLSIEYSQAIPVLVEALKEQQKVIQALENKVKDIDLLKTKLYEVEIMKAEIIKLNKILKTDFVNAHAMSRDIYP